MSIIKSLNPATLEVNDTIKETDPNELNPILKKAKQIQKQWKKTSLAKRKSLFKKLIEFISENMDQIARTIHNETGKPRIEAINSDVLAGLGAIRYTIDILDDVLEPKKIEFTGMKLPMWYMGRSSYIHPQPLGVIGIISPWNYPFGIPFSQVVMAVAVGNAVILKPSSETPLTGLKIQEVFEKVGFPKHLVQVVPGSGSKIGSALVKSDVGRIIFTGSVGVGKKIMEMASQALKPITLELGGKSPMIVLKDADLKRTVSGATWGCFLNAGQTCAGIKRIYIHEDIYDDFLGSFKQNVENLKQGWDWDDPEISIGPVINESALKDMQNHVKKAKEQGATIVTGGKKKENTNGLFFEPTIISAVSQDMDAVQEEIFGPIVTVLKFSTVNEAIEMANDTIFGLFGSVWTKDLEKGEEIAKQMTMGTIAVNNHVYTYGLPHTPWGGNKKSGIGRTHGKFGFEELLEPHHIHIDSGKIKEDLWWQPYNQEKLELQSDINDVLFRKKHLKMFKLIKKLKK
ncbi:MAG: aldehyde dehydrogenase family protein [Promethearchaeia archaeon]